MLKPIIFLQGTTSFGGSKRSLLTLTEILPAAGFQPIIACGKTGWLTAELEKRNVPFFLIPFYGWRKFLHRPLLHLSITRQWLPRMQAFQPRLIHSNEFWWAPHACLIAKKLKVPSVVHLRTGVHDLNMARQYRLHGADALVCISNEVKEKFSREPALYSRSRVIFNGGREENFSDAEISSARRALDLPEEAVAIGNLGKLCENKNQHLLIRVAGKLKQVSGLPPFRIFLAGDGDPAYENFLKEEVVRLQLQDVVQFLGRIESRPLFAAIDFLVHCSHSEGLSRTIGEAMLSRRAVITVDSGGVRDAIPDDRFGSVVNVSDEAGLQSRIEVFLRDKTLRCQIAQAALERARTVFSLTASRDALADLYQELLLPKPPIRHPA